MAIYTDIVGGFGSNLNEYNSIGWDLFKNQMAVDIMGQYVPGYDAAKNAVIHYIRPFM